MYVSINSHTIRKNATRGTDEPPIRIARTPSDMHPRYAHDVKIKGDSRLLYNKDKAITRCGARLVLVCDDLEIIR